MTMMTKFWEALGLSRDSFALFWAKWCGFVLALAAMGGDVTKVGIPAKYAPYLALAAMFISVSAAQHRTSELEGAPKG